MWWDLYCEDRTFITLKKKQFVLIASEKMDEDFGGYMENLQKAEAAAGRRAQMMADHQVRLCLRRPT